MQIFRMKKSVKEVARLNSDNLRKCFLMWCPISWASTTSISSTVLFSKRVSPSRTLRVFQRPASAAFSFLVFELKLIEYIPLISIFALSLVIAPCATEQAEKLKDGYYYKTRISRGHPLFSFN